MAVKGLSALTSSRRLYRLFNASQKKQFIWLILLTFIGSISDLVGLAFVLPLISLVLSPESYHTLVTKVPSLASLTKNELLLYSALLFFVVIILKNLLGLYINKLQVNFVKHFYVSSSMNVLDKIYKKPLLDIQKDTSNELVSKLTYYQAVLCSNAAISTIILINETIIFSLTAITVCFIDWKLFLLLIIVMLPIMGGFYARVKSRIKTAGLEKTSNATKLYANAQEMIFGYTDIKIAGTEQNFKKRFEQYADNYSVYQARLDFMQFIPTRILEVAIFISIILILLYGVFIIKNPEQIVATISVFSIIAYRSIPSVNRFVMAMSNLNSTEFVFNDPEFELEEQPKNKEQVAPLTFNDTIRFEQVSYHYPNTHNLVIKDCNLEIRKGEKIGIIGKSGSGKSTLIGNILGFLYPTEGQILVDGSKLNQDNIPQWWKVLGYVRQEVFIMNKTFAENIAIGESREQIDIKRMERAIKLSSLGDLVASWPAGMFTMLNERGNNLSGGQKQRIAIARAIYKGAEILIFDEATSALDSKTEEEITNAIRELGNENLTIVIIAHRYTSLKYCDKIYELQNGHITNSISYDKLMADYAK